MHRRDLLLAGVATGFALFSEQAFAQSTSGKVVPWADQPPPIPPPAQNAVHNLTAWESLELLAHAERQVLQHRPL